MARKRTQKENTVQETLPSPRYPDLAPALMLLADRMEETSSEKHLQLFEKWSAQLLKVQQEIQHLQKLEAFSTAVSLKEKKELKA